MDIVLACKAFWKALKDEKKGKEFVEGKVENIEKESLSHLRLLALLQQEGRLVDFLKEDITHFSDARIGGAVRQIHTECSKALEEFVTLRPLYYEGEGERVTVHKGYDPQMVKITGRVRGHPPYQGILRHKGWKAHKRSLPAQMEEGNPVVICPAEVEML